MSLLESPPAAEEGAVPENKAATPEHCYFAFDTLYCELTGRERVKPTFPDEKYPLFVTWNTRSTRPGRAPRLRGCIGTFDAQPVHEGILDYAIYSAFKDTRFAPIVATELPTLECAISLLTDFEDASSYLDWTVGIHGIYISFTHPALSGVLADSSATPSPTPSAQGMRSSTRFTRRPLTATYLPDVMPEQGWDQLDAIDSAIRKAGWEGRITEDLRRSIKLRRYQSSKCTVSYEEFIAWRTENGGEV
ncbi:alport syndrome [Fomitiporia mediterranea MF3/22]|uniref:alport syndrome n=1 Tax=Fomitiporia mediterranea (strain MF3/22) TaxID=694068 RepID=UPI00044091DE|nr:alport syndrome [Fomitiporia mediterranea MF3/22]EJD01478.1 alport syndrome [Fomitiporia mediterranea MF3/22]